MALVAFLVIGPTTKCGPAGSGQPCERGHRLSDRGSALGKGTAALSHIRPARSIFSVIIVIVRISRWCRVTCDSENLVDGSECGSQSFKTMGVHLASGRRGGMAAVELAARHGHPHFGRPKLWATIIAVRIGHCATRCRSPSSYSCRGR